MIWFDLCGIKRNQQQKISPMSKRAHNDVECPRIKRFALADDLVLRVRMSESNVDGSVMLFRLGRCLECVHLMQATDCEYTEEGWLTRYGCLYGANVDGRSDEEIMLENEDAKKFSTKLSTQAVSSSAVMGCFRCHSPRIQLIAADWDQNTIDLKMEIDKASSKTEIGGIEHISLRLRFVEL